MNYSNNHVLFIQPIVNLNRRYEGFECLLRQASGDDEERRFMSAEKTILKAESEGTIHKLDLWVLEQAKSIVQRKSLPGEFITINVSSITLSCDLSVRKIIKAFADQEEWDKRLVLEITETAKGSMPKIIKNVRMLKEHGIKVVLDDFGSGYNALGMLASMDVASVKISKDVIHNLDGDKAITMLHKMIEIIQEMGIKIVLEGLETDSQIQMAEGMNVEYMQGFRLGKPMLPEHYENVFASHENHQLASIR